MNLYFLCKKHKSLLDGFTYGEVFESHGTGGANIEEADVVLVKRQTPFHPRSQYLLEQFFIKEDFTLRQKK